MKYKFTEQEWDQIVADAFSPDAPEPCFSAQYLEKRKSLERRIAMKKTTGRKKFSWMAGMAAAAAIMICGTVTAGALCNWQYSELLNRYFRRQNVSEAYEDFDFEHMGLDINDTIERDDCTVTMQSVIADANTLCVMYNFRLSPEYEAQLPQTGETIYGSFAPSVRVKNADGTIFGSRTSCKDAERNADGSFDMMCAVSMENCQDYSDKILECSFVSGARAGTKAYLNFQNDTDGIYTPASERIDWHEYSLNGITLVPGITFEGVTLTDGEQSAEYDSVTVSPLRITFRRCDVPVTPRKEPEPGVTVNGGAYGYGFLYDETYSEIAAAADESDVLSSPVPHEYTRTCLRSLSLIFSDGTEQEVDLDFGLGSGRTKLSESGQYDCMDIESFATFHRPVSLQNLTAIRINGAEVSLK